MRAQCLNNIRKAFELLKQKKNMPVDLLFCEEQVHQGDTSVIIPLLQQMKKAYGVYSMAKTPPRKRRQSTPIRRSAAVRTPGKSPNRWK